MDVPKPNDTGSVGTQEEAKAGLVPANAESPLKGLPITQAITGLAATSSKSLGGAAVASLLVGSFCQLNHDFETAKKDLQNTREELNQAQRELTETKVREAKLQERAGAQKREKRLTNLCIFIGTALIGIGIDLYKNNLDISYLIGGLGLVLLLFPVFYSPKAGDIK